jgi:hypothetical protein
MKTIVALGCLVAMVVISGVIPAAAEPRGLVSEPDAARVETPRGSSWLDLDLKLGVNTFRLGGRLFGRDGYAGGAWLNGEMRRDGFRLDGRIERDGKTHEFKLDADIDAWVRRTVRPWGVTDL